MGVLHIILKVGQLQVMIIIIDAIEMFLYIKIIPFQYCVRQPRPPFKMAAVIKNRNVFSCQFPLYYKSVKEIDDGPRPVIINYDMYYLFYIYFRFFLI
jgi:hypothetical protein